MRIAKTSRASAGTPAAIIQKLNAAIEKVVHAPDFSEQLATEGALPQVTSPERFSKYVEAEVQKWAKVIRASGAKVE